MNEYSTKALARYHTPFISTELQKMAVNKEKLQIAVDEAWTTFLRYNQAPQFS